MSLDLAKGIGIVLMVSGHSGSPEWLNRVVMLFNMPIFFFISGLLLSEKHIGNLKLGIRKKLTAYYVPYVKYTLIFILLHNLFYALHIYDNSYTLPETAIRCVKTLFMTTGEQMLGGFWFMISMTWAALFSILFLNLLKNRNALTYRYIGGGYLHGADNCYRC